MYNRMTPMTDGYGRQDIGPMTRMMDITGCRVYGWLLLPLGFYGHLDTGVFMADSIIGTGAIGDRILAIMEALIMVADIGDMVMTAVDGKAVISATILLFRM